GSAGKSKDLPLPVLSIRPAATTEGNFGTTTLRFPVTLSTASAQPVTVAYTTTDGTAQTSLDYLPTAGTLTFSPGQLAATITVPVLGDTLEEPNETFFVNLSNPTGATLA